MKNFWSSSKFDQMTNHKVCVCVNEWWWSRKPKRYRNWIVNFYFHFLLNFATIHIIFMLVFFYSCRQRFLYFFFVLFCRFSNGDDHICIQYRQIIISIHFSSHLLFICFFSEFFHFFFGKKKIVKKFPHTPKKIKML